MISLQELENLFESAARTERHLPDRERSMLNAKASWPPYLYDADDRKDQDPERLRVAVSAADIAQMERVIGWLRYVGMRKDLRTIRGKKTVWMRAQGFIFGDIAEVLGMSETSVKRYYQSALSAIAKKIIF